MTLRRIKKEDNTWIEGNVNISSEAINFFSKQFTDPRHERDFSIVKYLPKVITEDDNEILGDSPTLDEIKEAFFSLHADSVPGTDGVSGKFYQHCWNIIAKDLYLMVCDFFAELRPTSLSNFSYKIISKMLNTQLTKVIHKIVSPNQMSFLKGRFISNNIMLTQEMVHNIGKNSANGNVVLKLDMAKAFDRVDWKYLCQALKTFRFSDYWTDMIWRLLSDNWYSVNINGERHGFFKSSRGIKQGDPISPFLFIISSELLSVLIDQLKNKYFIPYTVDKGFPIITHLIFADDTILFSSGDPLSLMAMMNKLAIYEKYSGQLINRNKSCFIVGPNTSQSIINDIKQVTGYGQQKFPFDYLGAPIYNGRKKIVYFGKLVSKAANRMKGWQRKMISHRGKVVLIKSVLFSMPLHTLSVIQLTKTTINQIEKIMANLF
ncbi:hypothetical protein P3S68_019164 [Capsicum galapagoense]